MFSYGYKPDAAYLHLAESVAEQTGEAVQPGRWFVNSFPARRYTLFRRSQHTDIDGDVDSEMDTICHFSAVGLSCQAVVRGNGQNTF